jgi:hypothetical protein
MLGTSSWFVRDRFRGQDGLSPIGGARPHTGPKYANSNQDQEDENGGDDEWERCVMSAATSAESGTSLRQAPSAVIGAVLFIAWGIETIMWVGSTINLAGSAIITAVAAIALLCLLAAMEGLEVAVIDRWKVMYPDRSTAQLAKWLAARQLFVALIVTTATILAHRDEVIIPFTGVSFDQGILLAIFDLTWTGFTVLWFAQILPKHLAATNPDRYLSHLRRFLFPVVEAVNKSGIPRPGAWTARVLERRLNWPLTQAEQMQEALLPREESLGHIWRELNTEEPASGGTPPSHDPSQTETQRAAR